MTSREVVQQAEGRLLNALGRRNYEPHLSELIEFSSFFAAALVASQDGFLASKFSKKEAERAKAFFMKEGAKAKVAVVAECFNAPMTPLDSGDQIARYSMKFEDYLTLVAHYELSKQPRWKLARQALQKGVVFVNDNLLNDLFGDCAEKAIADGVKNLRKALFPKQLSEIKASLARYIPVQKSGTGRGYLYVDHLLKHPVADGRHRLVWLVLAPYLVNVKKLADDEAIDEIRAFVSVAGETSDMRRFIEYNVRRARRNGLLPPTFSTLKNEHPDLYSLLPKEALATDATQRPKSSRARL